MQNAKNHIDYAERVSSKFYKEKRHAGILKEEFKSAAYFGLCQASTRYLECRDASFKTFSYFRIKGAMSDLLRDKAREPSYSIELDDAEEKSQLIFDEILLPFQPRNKSFESIEEDVMREEMISYLKRQAELLSEKEKEVITMKYFKGYDIRQICEKLGGVNPSWISKLHTRGLSNLRKFVKRDNNKCSASVIAHHFNSGL